MENGKLKKYIDFSKPEDTENYELYSKIRSKYLYYVISKYQSRFLSQEKVLYEEVSYIIRFDKALKNKLYIFISTYEEYLKTQLFLLREENLKKILGHFKQKEPGKILIWQGLKSGKKFISIYEIWDYIIQEKLNSNEIKVTKKDIDQIRKLRNLVMHFAFIIFPLTRGWTDKSLKKHLKELNNKIESLRISLPEPYPAYLKREIISCFESKDRKKGVQKEKKLNEKLKGYIINEIKICS